MGGLGRREKHIHVHGGGHTWCGVVVVGGGDTHVRPRTSSVEVGMVRKCYPTSPPATN